MAIDRGMEAAAHVLVFPWPLQGHINCMLHLANALLDAGLHVTFLHTDHNLRRLAAQPAHARLRLVSIPDGLPDDHPRSVAHLNDIMDSMRITSRAAFRALLLASSSNKELPPVTCVIADGIMEFALDVAEEAGVPAIAFRTASACSFLAYLFMRRLIESGEAPFPSDQPVSGVPGMEGFLRRRDLPRAPRSAARATNEDDDDDDSDIDPMLLKMGDCTANNGNARALILNTSANMETAALANIAPHMRDVFSVGPLHATACTKSTALTASLWREDDGCMAWLDGHEDRSVVYVSLGSLTLISEEQLAEFLSGLDATGYAFIWVLRPDMVAGGTTSLTALKNKMLGSKKARVVEWAPQRDVLRHRAVGCFLTHAGWNSTLEAACEGVPMVCWTFFADQLINSRFVDAVWRTGVDIKDVCDRAVVERAVRETMESAKIRAAAQAMARQLRLDVADGGSSSSEIKRLVAFIRELRLSPLKHSALPSATDDDVDPMQLKMGDCTAHNGNARALITI